MNRGYIGSAGSGNDYKITLSALIPICVVFILKSNAMDKLLQFFSNQYVQIGLYSLAVIASVICLAIKVLSPVIDKIVYRKN